MNIWISQNVVGHVASNHPSCKFVAPDFFILLRHVGGRASCDFPSHKGQKGVNMFVLFRCKKITVANVTFLTYYYAAVWYSWMELCITISKSRCSVEMWQAVFIVRRSGRFSKYNSFQWNYHTIHLVFQIRIKNTKHTN